MKKIIVFVLVVLVLSLSVVAVQTIKTKKSLDKEKVVKSKVGKHYVHVLVPVISYYDCDKTVMLIGNHSWGCGTGITNTTGAYEWDFKISVEHRINNSLNRMWYNTTQWEQLKHSDWP